MSTLAGRSRNGNGAGGGPAGGAAGLVETGNGSGRRFRPLQVTWEMTRSCDWKATHLRPSRVKRDPKELSTAEAFHLVNEVAALHVPLLVLTGGDPLLRADVLPVIEYAARRSVRCSLTLQPTQLLDAQMMADLKAAGLVRVAFWMHGSTASFDDARWPLPGAHRRTLEMIEACHEVGLPVQINTILSKKNMADVDAMVEVLTRLDVAIWNVIFLVPTTPEQGAEMLSPEEHEQMFAKMYLGSETVHFQIKATEAQHYQRYLLQQQVKESRGRMTEADIIPHAPNGISDGKLFAFIDHSGEVLPSRYLPVSAGNVLLQSLGDLYCEAPLFSSLRDSSRLKGKCGRCPVRDVCGGSRARAYAASGDIFAADPSCAYQP